MTQVLYTDHTLPTSLSVTPHPYRVSYLFLRPTLAISELSCQLTQPTGPISTEILNVSSSDPNHSIWTIKSDWWNRNLKNQIYVKRHYPFCLISSYWDRLQLHSLFLHVLRAEIWNFCEGQPQNIRNLTAS